MNVEHTEPIPASTNELRPELDSLLDCAVRVIYATGREYNEQLPADARAFATLVASGSIVPAIRIVLPREGARVSIGFEDASGTFHPIFSCGAHDPTVN